ncbi:MAG: type II secretion system protein [Planctomycetota bacterium]
MSIDNLTGTRRLGSRRGFTLVEVLIVLVITVFLVSTMANLIITTGDAAKYDERMARATEVNQEIINDLRTDLLATVNLFESGPVGDGYFDALDKDPSSPPLGTSALPTVIINGTFAKETTSGAMTGNVLMFAGQAWTTEFTCTSSNSYLVDVYRIHCFYLTKEDGGPKPGTAVGLNLTKFVGEPLADRNQIDAIVDPVDQGEVLTHLLTGSADAQGDTHPPVKLVWRRGRDITELDAMGEIDPFTGMISSTPVAPRPPGAWRILREPPKSSSGLLHYRHFSLASNYGARRFGVARFGLKSSGGDGFPHGFEVQIVGPSSSREVLVHISIVSTNHKGTRAHSDLRTTMFVQDV